MKKKKFKSLKLYTYKISNLSLLHRKKGGTLTTDTNLGTDVNLNDPYETQVGDYCLTLLNKTRCGNVIDCATNGSDTKAPPPSEHETCQYNLGS